MSNELENPDTPLSNELLQQLKKVSQAPLLERGKAGLCLAGMTALALRNLESRIVALEGRDNDA